ncbi:hypothetical protein Tco_0762769 [Tanacetum coccineum]
MFDEYFNPPTIAISPVPVATTPRAVDIADSPVSASIVQDTPSTSIPSTQEQEHSLIISQDVEESPKTTLFHDDPLHEDSTSQGSSSNVRPSHTPFEFIGRWTKDHPIANMIGDPSRSVSTIKQLKTNVIDSVDTPMVEKNKLDKDLQGDHPLCFTVRGMFGSYQGTINMGLWYSKDNNMSLTAYSDADHAGCQDTRRSTSGSAQFLGDKLVSWSSKKQ